MPIRVVRGLPRLPLPWEFPLFLSELVRSAVRGGIGAPPNLSDHDRQSILGGFVVGVPGMPCPIIRRADSLIHLREGRAKANVYYALPLPLTETAYREFYALNTREKNGLGWEAVSIVRPGAVVWLSLVRPRDGRMGMLPQLIVKKEDVVPLTAEAIGPGSWVGT